jgi:CelD/BcsL family acetyltransferase involved in cellulose biosynthesis
VRVARAADLDRFLADWEDLSAHAAEPNIFYEPWMALPALDAYSGGRRLLFVFVFEERDGEAPLLCGFFPLEDRPHYRGVPLPVLRMWSYVHCFLGTPLLREGHERSTLAAFFRWLRQAAPAHALFEMPQCAAEGPVHQALTAHLLESGSRYLTRRWKRAVFSPRAGSRDYLADALSGKKRKEVRRLERRLADHGPVTVDGLGPWIGGEAAENGGRTAAGAWAEEFLELEAAGWKGSEGTALSCRPADREFFCRIVTEAHARGRLQALALRVGGRPVALKCNFLAGDGGFAFKIAYDEEYAQLSPGYLLEIETIRRLHAHPEIRWMDSCAVPGHPMAERLWTGRRALQTVLVASDGLVGRLVISAVAVARALAHRLGRRDTETPTSTQEE